MDRTHKHTHYYNLRDAVAQPGCPICRLALDAVARYFDGLMFEDVNDPPLRKSLREARGFCNSHAWQMRDKGNPLGVAIIQRDILQTLARALSSSPYEARRWQALGRVQAALTGERFPGGATSVAEALGPHAPCPACEQQFRVEDIFLGTLLEYLEDAELAPLLRASAVLCLPHLREALKQIKDERSYTVLLEIQLGAWQRLVGELDEIIRKYDYRFKDEAMGEEADAWVRAIAQVAGQPGIVWRSK